ncbi:MAG: hypothetical protein AAFY19_11355 [Pseudomonadota bacterium]
MMSETDPSRSVIDEKSLRQAITHLARWHAAGSVLSISITFIPAFLIASMTLRDGSVSDIISLS